MTFEATYCIKQQEIQIQLNNNREEAKQIMLKPILDTFNAKLNTIKADPDYRRFDKIQFEMEGYIKQISLTRKILLGKVGKSMK